MKMSCELSFHHALLGVKQALQEGALSPLQQRCQLRRKASMRSEGVFGVRTMGVCDDSWTLAVRRPKGLKPTACIVSLETYQFCIKPLVLGHGVRCLTSPRDQSIVR
jgi:hypothetical protein